MNKTKLIVCLIISFISITCLISSSMSSQQRLINFQGRLTDYELRGNEVIKYVRFQDRRVAMVKGRIQDELPTITQRIILNEGWNMISLYVEPQDPAINNIISDSNGIEIQIYEYNTELGIYKGYTNNQKDLSELHANRGYLVWSDSQCTLTIEGRPGQEGVNLKAGWNLTGLGLIDTGRQPPFSLHIQDVIKVYGGLIISYKNGYLIQTIFQNLPP